MFVHVALHHPKGPAEKSHMMSLMPEWAGVEGKHKGFVQLVVAEVEDENILIPFTIWEREEDYMAARSDLGAYLSTIDFSVQEGPTRAGQSVLSKDSNITTIKVAPVRRIPT